jgi:hypothetical protein
MGSKSFEQCLVDIFKDIEIQKHVDYESKASVRRYNAAGDRIRSNFQYIDQKFPHSIDTVIKLLDHSDPDVVVCCAIAMQEILHCSISDKRKAIEKVKQLLTDKGLNTANDIWLSLIWIKQAEKKLGKTD